MSCNIGYDVVSLDLGAEVWSVCKTVLTGDLGEMSHRVDGYNLRVGTIQYVYRSVSIPYSTPVSCMVSPTPNEDPVGTTKCPLNPWFYDIFKLIPTMQSSALWMPSAIRWLSLMVFPGYSAFMKTAPHQLSYN